MNAFLEIISRKVLVSDGAMGTMLQRHNLPTGHCPEEWNISHAQVVAGIHKEYYDAGADLVETNTFGGNRFRLDFHNLGDHVHEYNKNAALIARSVCPKNKFVAGSVGPTGEFMEPLGTRTFNEMLEVFQEQITALTEGGVDVLIVETMADTEEVRAAIEAAKSVNPDIPVIATMTFEKTAGGIHTMMGIDAKTMAERLPAYGADVIGANCGMGMQEMMEVVRHIRNVSDFPILSQANAGSPVWDGKKNIYTETPEERGQAIQELLKLKTQIVGGCCGTTPDHIRAIRRTVDAFNRAS